AQAFQHRRNFSGRPLPCGVDQTVQHLHAFSPDLCSAGHHIPVWRPTSPSRIRTRMLLTVLVSRSASSKRPRLIEDSGPEKAFSQVWRFPPRRPCRGENPRHGLSTRARKGRFPPAHLAKCRGGSYSRSCTSACVPLVRHSRPLSSKVVTVFCSSPTTTSDFSVRSATTGPGK